MHLFWHWILRSRISRLSLQAFMWPESTKPDGLVLGGAGGGGAGAVPVPRVGVQPHGGVHQDALHRLLPRRHCHFPPLLREGRCALARPRDTTPLSPPIRGQSAWCAVSSMDVTLLCQTSSVKVFVPWQIQCTSLSMALTPNQEVLCAELIKVSFLQGSSGCGLGTSMCRRCPPSASRLTAMWFTLRSRCAFSVLSCLLNVKKSLIEFTPAMDRCVQQPWSDQIPIYQAAQKPQHMLLYVGMCGV